jgi:alpha-aminoadipic semialdehyde synthase
VDFPVQRPATSHSVSFCPLPATRMSLTTVVGYKFSWSPRGVLTAALNPATFRLSSAPYSIPGSSLLANHFPTVPIIPGFNFEGVANRDSISYLAQYGLENDLPTILRGTLRYKGFSRVVDVFTRMGLLEVEEKVTLERWEDLTDICLRARGIAVDGEKERMRAVQSIVGGDVELAAEVIDTLRA